MGKYSEYNKKEYREIFSKIAQKKINTISAVAKWITQGPNPSFGLEENIPCLTGRNIAKGHVNYENADYVSEEEYCKLKRFQLNFGDTLITLKGAGSIGKVGFVFSNQKAIFSRDIGIVRSNCNINAAFLNAYFLSKYGNFLVLRGETGGTGQRTLTTTYLKNLPIPRFERIEELVGQVIINSEKLLTESKCVYTEAEKVLIADLQLHELSKPGSCNLKTFSNSFAQTGRLDAEYYQPKYDTLIKVLSDQKNDKLGNLVKWKKSIEPGSNTYGKEGVPFVRISNLSKEGIISPEIRISREIVINIEELFPKKNTILLSKDGSVGIAYKVEQDLEVITSGGILHLAVNDVEEINPDYLTLVLNSSIVQLQAERDSGGSIIQHWKPSEIENVVIPILDKDMQKKIAEKVQESFALRKESERLLEVAKRAVEIAIEEDEVTALSFLKEQVGNDVLQRLD